MHTPRTRATLSLLPLARAALYTGLFAVSSLLGVGLEPAASLTATGFPPHNQLAAALFQGGMLFTAGVCLVIWRAARAGVRGGWASSLHAAVSAGAVTALVFAMTAPSVYNRYFWVPLAFAIIAGRTRLDRGRSQRPSVGHGELVPGAVGGRHGWGHEHV